MHCSAFGNNLVVMYLLALLWLTNSVHIYQASIILKDYVFSVSCYLVYTCMHDGTYDLLHMRTNALYVILLKTTYILWHK